MDQSSTQSNTPSNDRGQRLNERVILVTGALEGIGRAVALACAAEGATVILSSFEEVDLEPVYDAIVANGGPEPAILPLNLQTASERDFIAAADIVADTFERLDGLVHCAASAPFLSRIDDYDTNEWEGVIRVNLTAPFMLTQACMPILRLSKDASIVFTSDRVGRTGMAYWGAYAAAKFGIEGLMQVLADETRDSSHIRVNSLDPGILRTALRASLYPGEDPSTLPAPETVTEAYIQLLSAESQGMTGKRCSVDATTGRLT
ncbi:short-chain dehydrogenase/reductase SDR [Thiorhodococcus drewsii AZ1]|uniref:Short-chain dehydrogenase/reductase SDR n=1 Tax=Thiorhodococcus drewsii AZ1 TaxID=765913 RepID=G2DWQ8_9GAMM|nr:SDR family NAD(P)-dependent oxidoreductase [Thiorhodococcus drewsii]EGV33758.1 short-chain dehydrogenase/reductase SDR [Thiorhodococcus drewsii AZ1]